MRLKSVGSPRLLQERTQVTDSNLDQLPHAMMGEVPLMNPVVHSLATDAEIRRCFRRSEELCRLRDRSLRVWDVCHMVR